MNNISNITKLPSTGGEYYYEKILGAIKCTLVFQFVFLVAGTFLNLWLLFSILTSRDLRGQLRNQLICNLSISYLVRTLIKTPAQVAAIIPFLHFDQNIHTIDFLCRAVSTISVVKYIQSFLGNWFVVFLLTAALAQIFDFNLETKLTPSAVAICKVTVHIMPWIVIAIATPVSFIMLSQNKRCISIPSRHLLIFESVYTILPISMAILLTVVAFLLRYTRRGAGTTAGNLATLLMRKKPEMDNIFAYVVAVVICAGCEIWQLIMSFESYNRIFRGMDYAFLGMSLSDSRAILMVFPWLLLPDIRQRIRSWRPWKRQASGIDLTIAYQRDSENS